MPILTLGSLKFLDQCRRPDAARGLYSTGLARFTNQTSDSITGTSTRTPTTVASAAPELSPNREIATATANSKKLEVPIRQAGPAMLCGSLSVPLMLSFHRLAQAKRYPGVVTKRHPGLASGLQNFLY
jgi:hypothetical protein